MMQNPKRNSTAGVTMTVRDGVIEGSTITFLLSGDMSVGSTPLLSLLIRRSRRLGLAVTLDLDEVTGVDREVVRDLLIWQAEGVTLSDTPAFIRQWMRAEIGADRSTGVAPSNGPHTRQGITRHPTTWRR
jgi:hypothetical protein